MQPGRSCSMHVQSILREGTHRLVHYARTAAPPGGMRYLVRRTGEVAAARANDIANWFQTALQTLRNWFERALQALRLEDKPDPFLTPRHHVRKLVLELIRHKNTPIESVYVGPIAEYVDP